MNKISDAILAYSKVVEQFMKESDGKPWGFIQVNFQDGRVTTIERKYTYRAEDIIHLGRS